MTTDEIKQRIEVIQGMSGDSECAHAKEDELREDFIRYLSTLSEMDPDVAEKSKLVLSTNEISFERWFA